MIIAVGHTRRYMDALFEMLPDVPVFKVYNGPDPRPDELHVENHRTGRDIAMMKAGLDATGWKRATFLNDAIRYIDHRFWDAEGDIVGVANLSSWVDYDKCSPSELAFHVARGREPMFVRTSGFKMDADRFNEIWSRAHNNAQLFEKRTLTTDAKVNFVPPEWVVDNNTILYL